MPSLTSFRAFLALTILSLPLTQAQFVADLPQCVQNCIEQSPDTNCELTDIGCICRASAGNFLPDVVTCMHGNCDNSLDTNLLLAPLQFACMIAGAPIPASAIRNAQNQASSLASQVTTTVTIGGGSANGGGGATTTVYALSVSTVTVTTIQSGSTFYQVYPITIGSTTTESGPISTLTLISTATPSSGYTGVIPLIIISTNRAGSTYTITTTRPGAISTYTTTDSRGSITTQKSTFTETTTVSRDISGSSSLASSAGSTDSTSFTTTSVAAGHTSSSETASSKTSNAPNADETNSSPFKDTNSRASKLTGSWLKMSVLLAMVCIWL